MTWQKWFVNRWASAAVGCERQSKQAGEHASKTIADKNKPEGCSRGTSTCIDCTWLRGHQLSHDCFCLDSSVLWAGHKGWGASPAKVCHPVASPPLGLGLCIFASKGNWICDNSDTYMLHTV